MNKFLVNKKLIIIVGIVVLAAIGSGGYFFIKGQSVKSPLGNKTAQMKAGKEELAIWKDPMGFSFEYPKKLRLNPHDEDKENYAHLEFTTSGSAGNIIVWSKDTTYTSLDDWVTSDKMVSTGSSLDTTWGGQNAKKVSIKGEKPKVVTAALYDGLIFLAEENPDKDKIWNQAYDVILTAFKFYPIAGSGVTSSDNNAAGDNADNPSSENVPQDSTGGGDEEVVE